MGDLLSGGLASLLGSALGGVFRFGQAILDAREKQRDRDHELALQRLNGEQAAAAGEQRMREMGLAGDIQLAAAEVQALVEGVKAQASEAAAAGGWAARLSATVRPILTYLLVLLYLCSKLSGVAAALGTADPIGALGRCYGPEDMAVLASILSFWFVDRAIRKGSPLGRAS
jgi:hypothetical protein